MSLARLVVTAVRIEGRTKAEVCRDYGVSPRWVIRRYEADYMSEVAALVRASDDNP